MKVTYASIEGQPSGDLKPWRAVVIVLAIGIKRRERVWIGGDEYKL